LLLPLTLTGDIPLATLTLIAGQVTGETNLMLDLGHLRF
jgi:hypothetical protein